jgi:hypothetical protein
MLKYVAAAFFLLVGIFELTLAFHEPLRKALLEANPLLSERLGRGAFLVIGGSAILTGLGIILYGSFW